MQPQAHLSLSAQRLLFHPSQRGLCSHKGTRAPSSSVFQRHRGETDLKGTLKAAITHATENVRCNNAASSYSNLLQIYGVTLRGDNQRQSLVSIISKTLIFLPAGDSTHSLRNPPHWSTFTAFAHSSILPHHKGSSRSLCSSSSRCAKS